MHKISQSQISAYNKCRRLYFLKNIARLKWPSTAFSSNALMRGTLFHEVVHRHILGLPDEMLLDYCGDEKVRGWFKRFLEFDPLRGFDELYPEHEISMYEEGILWEGKYDVLARKGNKITIFDWKTTARKGKASDYIMAPQTKLYRLLAASFIKKIAGSSKAEPSDIQMIYWFPEHPENPVVLPYSEETYQQDLTWLKMEAALLRSDKIEDYGMTDDPENCIGCRYCTYCHTGAAASDIINDEDDEILENFDTDDYLEIIF